MSYNSQRIAIETHFKTMWESAHPTIPLNWSNVKLDNAHTTGFVRLDILNGDSALKGLGATKLYRYTGIVSVDIYTPQKQGKKNTDIYADTIDSIFRGQNISGITFRATNRADLGLFENYYRTNISIPFYRNEQFTT